MSTQKQFWLRSACRAAILMLCASPVLAQEDNSPRSAVVPSPMGIHTWFIIVAFGAILAWCISYSLQLQRDSLERMKSREGLLLRKKKFMEDLAKLESQRDAGAISEQQFKRQYVNTRLRLAKVLELLEQNQDAAEDH